MSDERNLRIFCPTHEAAFETAESPKILCEITEHALSVGFPHSEFWEFCCNCETFSPAKLDKGDKAQNNCYACGNEISKRFVCQSCKIVGFESNAQTKGKSYSITADGIEPACPGCKTVSQNGVLTLHKCKEVDAGFFTAREECPFCLEKTSAAIKPKSSATFNSQLNCPQCFSENRPNALFCSKCRYQLKTDVNIINPGSNVNKTQLLGSLCPNCSTPIPSDSDFCGECGQAVKKSVAPPPPPPPPSKNDFAETLDFNLPPPQPKTPTGNNSLRNVGIGIGGVFIFIIFLSIFISSSKSSGSSTFNSNANSAKTVNSSSNTFYNSTVSENSSTGNSYMSDSGGSESFERDYEGTINGRSFSMTLTKTGSELKGSASTSSNTDTVSGTIETDGHFRLNGYEDGNRFTGIYTGQIDGGSIIGRWTTTNGRKGASFSLEER